MNREAVARLATKDAGRAAEDFLGLSVPGERLSKLLADGSPVLGESAKGFVMGGRAKVHARQNNAEPRGFRGPTRNPMFKKLKSLARQDHRSAVDPSRFGDPLAQQVDWSPLSRGGANFRTHRLVPISDSHLEFRSTLGARLFAGVFLFFGALAPGVIFVAEGLEPSTMFSSPAFGFGALFSTALVGAGIFLFRQFCSPIVFDKATCEYTRKKRLFQGGKSPEFPINLQRIRGVQILKEWVSGSESSYDSYELNAVLEDASRVLVVDHGNRDQLVSDAEVLAAFLGVPLWDATSEAYAQSKADEDGG